MSVFFIPKSDVEKRRMECLKECRDIIILTAHKLEDSFHENGKETEIPLYITQWLDELVPKMEALDIKLNKEIILNVSRFTAFLRLANPEFRRDVFFFPIPTEYTLRNGNQNVPEEELPEDVAVKFPENLENLENIQEDFGNFQKNKNPAENFEYLNGEFKDYNDKF
ncbi:hypothetical protein B9Z55_011544 [Caenorhabditis nigoni]|uniref:Uncharacterized protein n=1 Tax=Caenorhabditis nigoni TaxID=1611254 RepID=A0A2G5UKT5_9PELO|nr:hypothetical protein B9Z55_011544 [Caenorhabditis nigoni]